MERVLADLYKELKTAENRLVGTKQVLRAIAADEIRVLYIAKDADAGIKDRILSAAEGRDISVVYADNMRELGDICGIEVCTACAAVKRQTESGPNDAEIR